jgi:hypothetical protein
MTAAAFQSLGISDDKKESMNRLVIIGVATISAHSFRKRGSRLSCCYCPAERFIRLPVPGGK